MTTITTILKYDLADTAGVVGQQPYKNKARFDFLMNWKYSDKLNKLITFDFGVPNDEFHRANALLEREVFVPFLVPFRGIMCKKSQDESRIDLQACEFAFHLTRRHFQLNGNRRITYGTAIANLQFEDDLLDSIGTNNGSTPILAGLKSTISTGHNNTTRSFAIGEVNVGLIKGIPANSTVTDLTLDINTAAGNIRLKCYDSVDGVPTNLLGESASLAVPATGKQKFAFTTSFLVPINGEIWIGFENDNATFNIDVSTTFPAGVETKSDLHTYGTGPDPFALSVNETYGLFLKVHFTEDLDPFFTTGKIGKAFNFNDSIRVNLANESNFDFDFLTNKMSVGFWINPDSTVTDSFPIIVSKRTDLTSTDTGWSMYWDKTNTNVSFEVCNGTAEFIVTTANTTVPADEFIHVLFTFGGGSNQDQMKIYLNGVLSATGTTSTISGTLTNALTVAIGAANAGVRPFKGIIDDVHIYSRELSADDALGEFKRKKNRPAEREFNSDFTADALAQDILDSANTDMPAGVTWKLSPDFPTDKLILDFNFINHYDALQSIAESLEKDLFFDNKEFFVNIAIRGKTLAPRQKLDLNITSRPEVSVEDFANEINILGKRTETGEQLEKNVTTQTVLRYNYEKLITDSKISTQDQLSKIGSSLLKEFQKITPQIKGTVPFSEFKRLNLTSGDIIKISQPEKQLNGSFRVMEIAVTELEATIALESTETGVIRVRSRSFTDIIESIIKHAQDTDIES